MSQDNWVLVIITNIGSNLFTNLFQFLFQRADRRKSERKELREDIGDWLSYLPSRGEKIEEKHVRLLQEHGESILAKVKSADRVLRTEYYNGVKGILMGPIKGDDVVNMRFALVVQKGRLE